MTTSGELRRAESDYRRALALADEAQDRRDEVIAKALADGWSQWEVGKAVGLGRSKVAKVAKAAARAGAPKHRPRYRPLPPAPWDSGHR